MEQQNVQPKLKLNIHKKFCEDYSITQDLKVFSHLSNKYIKINSKLQVIYKLNDKNKTEKIHYIAARMFLEKEEGKKHVIFKDGDSDNRHISNLAWSLKKQSNRKLEEILYINEKIGNEMINIELRKIGDTGYYTSENSDIYSIKKGSLKKLSKEKRSSGYEYINGSYLDVNKLVLKAFYPQDKELEYALFKDGDVNNKHFLNLIWSASPELEHESKGFETYEGFSNYKFSKDGICKSYFKKEPKIIKPEKDNDDYFCFIIQGDDGKKYKLRRNRVVAKIFIPNPDELPFVDHVNRKRWDDRSENLKWVTQSENSQNRDMVEMSSKISKNIFQFDLEGEIIDKFKNAKEVAGFLWESHQIKISGKSIRRHIQNNKDILEIQDNKPFHGYIWKDVHEKEKYIFKEGEKGVPLVSNVEDMNIDFPDYQITNYGNIINKKGYKLNNIISNGYLANSLIKNKKTINIKIHRYVALFFVKGRTKERNVVNHKDENKLNTHYRNLEWVTRSENGLHSSHTKMKAVDQFDSKTGEFIRRFPSVKDAGIFMKCASDSIGNICRREKGTLYGYIWKFADLDTENPSPLVLNMTGHKNNKTVNKYDKYGNFIQRYESIKDAANSENLTSGAVGRCCRGDSKTSGGFIWSFVDKLKK